MQYPTTTKTTSSPIRMAAISFLFNSSISASLVFLPLYAEDLGATRLQIGYIAAVYGITYFVSSFLFGRQSDIHGRLIFVRLGLLLAVAAYFLQTLVPDAVTLLLVRGTIGFCLGIASAAMMSYVYDTGILVGSFASFGSLGWLFGTIFAGILGDFESLFIVSAVVTGLAFMVSTTLKEERHIPQQVPLFPLGIILRNRKIYLPFLLRHMGATAIWAIFPLFLVEEDICTDLHLIAILYGLNTGIQFIAMRMVQRFNQTLLFTTGLILSAIVFAFYGIVTEYWQIIPIQIILAVSWSCLFIGGLQILLSSNKERGTAVGLLYSTNYLAAALGPFLGGAVSEIWGFRVLMFVALGMSLSGLFFSPGKTIDSKTAMK